MIRFWFADLIGPSPIDRSQIRHKESLAHLSEDIPILAAANGKASQGWSIPPEYPQQPLQNSDESNQPLNGRTTMLYKLTLKMLIDTPFDKDRVVHQVESLFEFGTISESVVDALGLEETPRLSSVSIEPASTRRRN
jgi:hypothetical protein